MLLLFPNLHFAIPYTNIGILDAGCFWEDAPSERNTVGQAAANRPGVASTGPEKSLTYRSHDAVCRDLNG